MKQPSTYNIFISDMARQMLGKHIAFLARKNVSSAKTAQSNILKSIRSLSEFPERYPIADYDYIPVNKYRKMFVQNWYLILYQIKNQTVYISYIIDCRQDYEWLL